MLKTLIFFVFFFLNLDIYSQNVIKPERIKHKLMVHSYIVNEAIRILPSSIRAELYTYQDKILMGAGVYAGDDSYSEDRGTDYYGELYYCSVPVAEHFWNPYDPSYVAIWNICKPPYYPSTALNRAEYIYNNYVIPNYTTNKEKAYYYLGRVLHLLADMSVPAHTYWVSHNWPNEDSFELYILDNYDKYKTDGKIIRKTSLKEFFSYIAKISRKYPTDRYEGYSNDDVFYYNNNGNLSEIDGPNNSLTQQACDTIAKDVIPKIISVTAGFIEFFYKSVNPYNI
ncbi:MAG: hypothetical protein N2Z20_05780 [Elusimicrobiales bacterium]|nr:hypothetical protein [Elusimicrobiales bacterium]